MAEIIEKLNQKYEEYREPGLDLLRVTHSDILPIIKKIESENSAEVYCTGNSIEGRGIYKIRIGRGKIKILLWSQMHGDETTATKAIFDLLNFFSAVDEFSEIKNSLLNELQITFVPMLNPDGAERHTRENVINIDLNRDAKSFQCPESILLQKIRDDIKPDFCFNLHDQNRYYSVGRTNFPAALSFLAPPPDYDRTITAARKRAIGVIVYMSCALNKIIPGRIAKYSDEHEPRSFGDNFVFQDSSVILIESGYIKGDEEKNEIRKLNFLALFSAFYSISKNEYPRHPLDDYLDIPENETRFYDLLLKNANIIYSDKKYSIDLGINRCQIPVSGTKEFYSKGVIEEMGDLSTFTGHEIIDCTGLEIYGGKIFTDNTITPEILDQNNIKELLNGGYTTLYSPGFNSTDEWTKLPLNLITRKSIELHDIKTGLNANLVLKKKDKIISVIINGFLLHYPFNNYLIHNSLIFY